MHFNGCARGGTAPDDRDLAIQKKASMATKPAERPHTKFLDQRLKRDEAFAKKAAEQVVKQQLLHTETHGLMQAESPLERTFRVSQRDIAASRDVDDSTRAKQLSLSLGDAYAIRFTHNGRHLVIGGRRGHLSVLDALRCTAVTELTLDDQRVYDVTPLHNHTLFAVAQQKYVYVYDHRGTEVHQLRSHIEPRRLCFLRYHMLLASIGRPGYLKYQDMSTGDLVATIRTKLGACDVLGHNPSSGVLASGHQTGVVCLWAPSQGTPLVKMLCHSGPVCAVAFDQAGLKMVTSGLDERVTVWDARMFGKAFSYHASPRPATHLAVSQRGLLAMGCGQDVRVFSDCLQTKAHDPYMTHRLPGAARVTALDFRPYEDVLGIGHSEGVQTIVVPGAGEASLDTREANPFERSTQRREGEVHLLLDKIPFDMIALPQPVGAVSSAVAQARLDVVVQQRDDERAAKRLAPVKRKMKGRGKIGSRLKTKHRNIWTVERELKEESEKKRVRDNDAEERARGAAEDRSLDKPGQRALKRFR